jgi:hypothetical protein
MFLRNAVEACHHILETKLKCGMTVVDATVGNGNDCMFIKDCIGQSGHLLGFDLDQRAIEITLKRLNDKGFIENITLFTQSHVEMLAHISVPIDAVVFNLGYLPGLSKDYITQSGSTLEAITQALELIKIGGFVIIVVYPGHPEGAQESRRLQPFISSLNQKKHHVFQLLYPNQVNDPPYLVYIERRT